eukprot:COSAG04_NODE_891_length_9607_cov_13.087085_4_plen_68_part_00
MTPRLVRSGEVEPLLVNRRKFDFRAFLLVGRTAPTVSHAPLRFYDAPFCFYDAPFCYAPFCYAPFCL